MTSISRTVALAVLLVLAGTSHLAAQRRPRHRVTRPAFTIEAYTGFSTFSRFIEQHVLMDDDELPPIGDRSLKADVAYILGGALGAWIRDGTAVRLGYTWATTEFDYEDSSGLDRSLLDLDDLNSLNTHIISLEVIQLIYVGKRLSPYLLAGINGEFWVLGDRDRTDAILTTDGSQFRWGANGGVGLQYRASTRLALRLEANSFILGSPFRGRTAFRPAEGLTFDKPDDVNMPRYTIGIIYSFQRRR